MRPSTATRKYRNMKARLRPHGGVANPRHSGAMAAVCALPCSRIHRFHLVPILPGRSTSYPGRRNKLIASPPITSTIATSFHAGNDSPSHQPDAAMPNTGTSSAIGVTVAAG